MADVGALDTLANAGKAIVDAGEQFGSAVASIPKPESPAQGEQRRQAQQKYDYKYLQYPSDMDTRNSRHPYWMTLYINKQELSQFKGGSSKAAFDKNKVAIRSTAQINALQGTNLQKNFGGSNIGFGRKTQRTAVAIRLFMPDTLSWSYANGYKDASISGVPLMGLASALTSTPALFDSSTEAAKKGGLAGVLASLQSPAARSAVGAGAELLGEASGQGAEFGVSVLGIAVNPQVDVIYISPELRQFTFDFMFSPQSTKDAQTIAQIIKELKFHSAPEMLGGGIGIGRYYVPPSEFDIEFSVDTMGRISTCVLQNITLDYAPSGTAFYNNNQPVNTRMTLQFKELEFMTKELIEKGF